MRCRFVLLVITSLIGIGAAHAAEPVFLLQWGGHGTGPGQFDGVVGVALDAVDNLYVVDQGNKRIQKFTADGVFLASFVGRGTFGYPFFAVDVAVGPGDTLYVSDAGNRRIEVYDAAFHLVRDWVMPNEWAPGMLALDRTGTTLYAKGGNRIYAFRTDGTLMTSWDFVALADLTFSWGGFCVGPGGLVYTGAGIEGTGIHIYDAAGSWVRGFGDHGTAEGEFYGWVAVAVDEDENVFVSGEPTGVQQFSPSGAFVRKLSPEEPVDLAVDRSGNLFVAGDDRILKFGPAGTPTMLCPPDTTLRPGRSAIFAHGFTNHGQDTLDLCLNLRGTSWPASTVIVDHAPVPPGSSSWLVSVQVPDTAKAGPDTLTWSAGCLAADAPACRFVITVPPLVGAAEIQATASEVSLSWTVADSSADTATVYRRENGGAWTALGSHFSSVGGRIVHTDQSMVPGVVYDYRLGLPFDARQIYCGDVTVHVPDLVESASAVTEPGRVRLAWSGTDPEISMATVERSAEGGPWFSIAPIVTDALNRWNHVDASVVSGVHYRYRLAVSVNGVTFHRGEVAVLAVISANELALAPATNPSIAGARVGVTVSSLAPIQLELFDTGGHLVASQRISLSVGRYVIDAANGTSPRPGIYFVRLTQRGEVRRMRLALLR